MIDVPHSYHYLKEDFDVDHLSSNPFEGLPGVTVLEYKEACTAHTEKRNKVQTVFSIALFILNILYFSWAMYLEYKGLHVKTCLLVFPSLGVFFLCTVPFFFSVIRTQTVLPEEYTIQFSPDCDVKLFIAIGDEYQLTPVENERLTFKAVKKPVKGDSSLNSR